MLISLNKSDHLDQLTAPNSKYTGVIAPTPTHKKGGEHTHTYISNVNVSSKISAPPEPEFKNMGQQMSCVENECCCPRAVNISNVNFTSNTSTPPEPEFKNMGQQMSGPDS